MTQILPVEEFKPFRFPCWKCGYMLWLPIADRVRQKKLCPNPNCLAKNKAMLTIDEDGKIDLELIEYW
ncbi:MAG: hypothetical protein ABII22_04655 [Candidatus Micrarchaeota archaeon]